MKKGFTLIELMIVIAIIAVIAAIAIPNLMQATISGNESTAVTQMRALAGAQTNFKRTDWYSAGFKTYANGATDLYEVSATVRPGLIDLSLAKAFADSLTVANAVLTTSTKIAKTGYCFVDNSTTALGAAMTGGAPAVIQQTFFYTGYPDDYGNSGRLTLIMNTDGTVYNLDKGSAAASKVTTYPTAAEIKSEKWISSS